MNKKLIWSLFRMVLSICGVALIFVYLFQEEKNPSLLTCGLSINTISIVLNARAARKKD